MAALLAGCAGAPPQITSLSPANGSRGVPADEPIRVAFDHPVDKSSVASRFRVDPPLPGCDLGLAFRAPADASCRVVWSDPATTFTLLHTGALFQPDLTYHLHLDPGVRDAGGVTNDLDHGWELTVAGAPVVRSTSPGDGSTAVPVDSPLVVTFSSAMAVAVTERAIHLIPDIPGTRVTVNEGDHSRFVVLPGRLLSPGQNYSLTVGTTAADEHLQPLAASVQVAFAAGGLSTSGHAVVPARADGELPSVLLLTRLGPDQVGEPSSAVTLLTAPRCLVPGCPAAGGPALGYLEAALSPAGGQVAVVERDTAGTAPDRLILVDLPSLATTLVATGAAHPSWSADGSTLAYGRGSGVELYTVARGSRRDLPHGDPLDAPPAWSADGSTLALQVRGPGQPAHVELADPRLSLRYPVPGLPAGSSAPALSAGGDTLAVRVDPAPGARLQAGTWTVRLRDGSEPQLLSPTLTPVAWIDAGTLLGIDRAAGGTSLVRAGLSGSSTALAAGPRDSDLSTVVTDISGRRIGFLRPDATGRVQAWGMNVDGSNPVQLTSLGGGAGLEAVAVSLGG